VCKGGANGIGGNRVVAIRASVDETGFVSWAREKTWICTYVIQYLGMALSILQEGNGK
jgi:hypothetical protein